MSRVERGPDGRFHRVEDDDDDNNNTEGNMTDDTQPERDSDGVLRDEAGSVVDPPVIPSFERELQEAHAMGDPAAIQSIQQRYDEAREDRAAEAAADEEGE